MSDPKGFPSDRFDALAMLWLQNQDLSGKTPSEIQTMYFKARKEMQLSANQDRFDGKSAALSK